MLRLLIKNRCLQLTTVIVTTLLTGIFYYTEYKNIIYLQKLSGNKLSISTKIDRCYFTINNTATANSKFFQTDEIQHLKKYKHLLWLPGIISNKCVFGTYDRFANTETIGQLLIYRMLNSTNGDFVTFIGDNDLRAIYGLQTIRMQIFGREAWVPVNKKEFLLKWENGRFLNCLGVNVSNSSITPVIKDSYIENLAKFRNFIESYQSKPFLFGGTLLGWYRECSFIRDTTDVDFAMKIESLNVTMLDAMKNARDFSLYWILGKVNDSLEVSVISDRIKMDLFILYSEQNSSWVGGMIIGKRKKLRWNYPPIPELCTGDLLGRLFHVPCNVEAVLKADYGDWTVPHATENFTWYESHRNIEIVGYWDQREWHNVYKLFKQFPR